MEHPFFAQFEMARSWTLEAAEKAKNEEVEIVPAGYNNNILWHLGHILAAAENFLFIMPSGINSLPKNYFKLFGTGTKPADWQGEVPAKQELIRLLQEQLERARNINPDLLGEKLEKPLFGFTVVRECTDFVVLHEALHVGKIEEMGRAIAAEAKRKNN